MFIRIDKTTINLERLIYVEARGDTVFIHLEGLPAERNFTTIDCETRAQAAEVVDQICAKANALYASMGRE